MYKNMKIRDRKAFCYVPKCGCTFASSKLAKDPTNVCLCTTEPLTELFVSCLQPLPFIPSSVYLYEAGSRVNVSLVLNLYHFSSVQVFLPVLVSSYAPELILKCSLSLCLNQQYIKWTVLSKMLPTYLNWNLVSKLTMKKCFLASRFSSRVSPAGPSDVYFAVKLHTLKNWSPRNQEPFYKKENLIGFKINYRKK